MNYIAEFYAKNKPQGLSSTESLFLAIKDCTHSVNPRTVFDNGVKSVLVGMKRSALVDTIMSYRHCSIRQAVISYAKKLDLLEGDLLWSAVVEDASLGIKLSLDSLTDGNDSRLLGFICEKKSDVRKEFGVARLTATQRDVVFDRWVQELKMLEQWANGGAHEGKDIVNGIVIDKADHLTDDYHEISCEAMADNAGEDSEVKTFKVTISEKSLAYCIVEAKSIDDAISMADEKYGNGEIEFTHYEDFAMEAEEEATL